MIAGDQNSDPLDGDSIPGAIQQLLEQPEGQHQGDALTSLGGPEQSALQGGVNDTHLSDPAFDTADFSDFCTGQPACRLRAAEKNMKIDDAAVFWPLSLGSAVPAGRHLPVPELRPPAGLGRRRRPLNNPLRIW